MKAKRPITYGVRDLLEWQMEIPVGARKLTLNFTGGMMTAYSATPASFTTDDPVLQRLIEGTAWFRKGRIFRIR